MHPANPTTDRKNPYLAYIPSIKPEKQINSMLMDDVIRLIFSHLDLIPLNLNKMVCRRWFVIVTDIENQENQFLQEFATFLITNCNSKNNEKILVLDRVRNIGVFDLDLKKIQPSLKSRTNLLNQAKTIDVTVLKEIVLDKEFVKFKSLFDLTELYCKREKLKKSEEQLKLVKELIAFSDFDEALAVAEKIEIHTFSAEKQQAFEEIVTALANKGLFNTALELANRQIHIAKYNGDFFRKCDRDYKGSALGIIIENLIEFNLLDRAQTILNANPIKNLFTHKSPNSYEFYLDKAHTAFLDALQNKSVAPQKKLTDEMDNFENEQDFEAVITDAQAIPEEKQRNHVLYEICQKLIEKGYLDLAETAVVLISPNTKCSSLEDDPHYKTVFSLVLVWSKRGNSEKAGKMLQTYSEDKQKVIIQKLCDALFKMNKKTKSARKFAFGMPEGFQRDEVCFHLALYLAKNNKYNKVVGIIKKISDRRKQAEALSQAYLTYFSSKEEKDVNPGMYETIGNVTDDMFQSSASHRKKCLEDLCLKLCEYGKPSTARMIAWSLRDQTSDLRNHLLFIINKS